MHKDEQLSRIFNRVSERHNLVKNLEEKKYKFMNENTFLEVHCIEWIEKMEDTNVTKLAKSLNVTRSAISKVTKHLVQTQLIERYQKPGNKKESYFKLTEKGRAIFDEHERMHQRRIERDQEFFSQLSNTEKEQLLQILHKVYGQIAKELQRLGLDNYI